MIVVDSSIFRFKGSELIVLLYLITHADERGVCNTSYSLLAHELNLSVQNCRTIMNRLKALNEVDVTSTNKISHVTVLKYDSYATNTTKHQQAKILEQQTEIDTLMARVAELEAQLEKGKKRKKSETPSVPKEIKKTIEERKHDFGLSLIPYMSDSGGMYPKEMIRAFYDYWTESNQPKTKMRWEMEKTWEVGKRLATWAKNNKVFNNNHNTYGRETATDKLRRTFDEANEFRNRLAAEREANLEAGDFE